MGTQSAPDYIEFEREHAAFIRGVHARSMLIAVIGATVMLALGWPW